MDARLLHVALLILIFPALGATHSTPNFVVEAPTPELAQKVAVTAEQCRDDIALDWLGQKLPRWSRPCLVKVKVGQIGAGGATTFAFDRGHVFGWNMNVQGTEERILDSVIPHEVSHTIFASHFRRPLPRWADEGAATLVEHESERHRQQLILNQVMNTSQRIPLKSLLAMKEYPKEMENILTLYAQGYSLADYLVQQGGKTRYLQFLEDAHQRGWPVAIKASYGLKGIDDLETRWQAWVIAGSPSLPLADGEQLAQNDQPKNADSKLTIRSQNPEVRNSSSVRPKALPIRQPAAKTNGTAHADQPTAVADLSRTPAPAKRRRPGSDLSAPAPHRKATPVEDRTVAEVTRSTADSADNSERAGAFASTDEPEVQVASGRRAIDRRRIDGRRRTLDAGWLPESPDAEGGETEVAQVSGRELPLTSMSVAEDSDTNRRNGERPLPNGRTKKRSGFPQNRTEDGPPQLGALSDFPPSP